MTINVKVRTLGVFKGIFGSKLLMVDLKNDSTVRDLVQKLVSLLKARSKHITTSSENNEILSSALILVNGKEISALNGLETIVSDEDEVIFLPVSHGG